jgi:SNF2 family DNA or RNA helicase
MLKLRPYQEEAANFLYENDRALVLAPVGAGKTAITLTAMEDFIIDGMAQRFLVLAPKRVCTSVWPVEGLKWALCLNIGVAIGTSKQRQEILEDGSYNVVVINYDNLQWLVGQDLSSFDAIVFDELTKLKNPSGKRFKALQRVIEQFPVRWGLTGSFTSNGLEDVFGQCKIVDEKLLGRAKGAFMQQYFVCTNRDFGDWAPRKGSLEQVMRRIKPATFLLEPGDYKDKLPPCHVVELRCEIDDRQPYETMKRDSVVTNKLQQMASGFVYDTTKLASAMPGKFTVTKKAVWFSSHKFDLLHDLLEENQHANTILVYQFEEELAEIKRRYPQVQTLDDVDAVERWNKGLVELMAIHPKSAGHGLNLQYGGSCIAFISLPWSLELYEQTVGRLHRSGQLREVWVYILMAQRTVDEKIWAALHDKRAISDIALEALK